MRYLRARRQEGFISVIAWFSLMGIALGVATLIIVMAVMNGFRQELLTRILGLNGHLSYYGQANKLTDFDRAAEKLRKVFSEGGLRVQVLNDIDFKVHQGERIAIVGASGNRYRSAPAHAGRLR